MEHLWEFLAVSLSSGALALCGVVVTNRHNERLQRETLRERAVEAQRVLVTDVLLAGREWADIQQVVVPIMSKASTEDLFEFADTDPGVRSRELRRRLDESLTRASMTLVDRELREQAAAVGELLAAWADVVNGPILNDQENFDHVLAGFTAIGSFQRALTGLQELAAARLEPTDWGSR
jgi:hypothetical protein